MFHLWFGRGENGRREVDGCGGRRSAEVEAVQRAMGEVEAGGRSERGRWLRLRSEWKVDEDWGMGDGGCLHWDEDGRKGGYWGRGGGVVMGFRRICSLYETME